MVEPDTDPELFVLEFAEGAGLLDGALHFDGSGGSMFGRRECAHDLIADLFDDKSVLILNHLSEEAQAEADHSSGKCVPLPLIEVRTARNICKENSRVLLIPAEPWDRGVPVVMEAFQQRFVPMPL